MNTKMYFLTNTGGAGSATGRTTRIVAVVVISTVAGILLAATYFRRRKRKPQRRVNGSLPNKLKKAVPVPPSARIGTQRQFSTNTQESQNYSATVPSQSPSKTFHSHTLSVSHVADEHIHGPDIEEEDETECANILSPQEMIHLGAASVDSALRYWEEALQASSASTQDVNSVGNKSKYDQLQDLLQRIKDLCSEYIAVSSRLPLASIPSYISEKDEDTRSEASSSDSFHSAGDDEELAAIESELAQMPSITKNIELYQVATVAVRHNQVHCRTIRTQMMCCKNREDFLAKVYCVRLALELLMKDESTVDWFADMGMHLIADILTTAGYATEDFYITFNNMMQFVKDPDCWHMIEQDLRSRKVKHFSFYDAVLDFLILDAFDDLEHPPASVLSIVQNRWLSQGVKETGLSAAIWSVLSAKKQMLQNPRGLIGRFYDLSKHVTPALAWGFMGTDEELNDLMVFFKDQVLNFTRSMFSLEKCRYSTVPELADDILLLARQTFEILNNRLES